MPPLTRRQALGLIPGLSAGLPRDLPPGVAAIPASTLKQDPASLNTDWFGALLVKGLLEWARRGVPEARDFAKAWLEFHLNSNRLAPYSGNRSRTVRAGGVVITTYCGHYGLSFPCYEIFQQLRDLRARRICLEVAGIILHQSARNRYGMVAHDDTAEFAIPDTCYFVVTPLMIAARLDSPHGAVYNHSARQRPREDLLDPRHRLAALVHHRGPPASLSAGPSLRRLCPRPPDAGPRHHPRAKRHWRPALLPGPSEKSA